MKSISGKTSLWGSMQLYPDVTVTTLGSSSAKHLCLCLIKGIQDGFCVSRLAHAQGFVHILSFLQVRPQMPPCGSAFKIKDSSHWVTEETVNLLAFFSPHKSYH